MRVNHIVFWSIVAFLLFSFVYKGFLKVEASKNADFQGQTSIVKSVQYDLSTTAGREIASAQKELSPYTVKNCTEVKHTDGDKMTFCIAIFDGTTSGFYNPDKELMVVSSFNQYTLIHEIFHASSLHYYKKGYIDMLNVEVQEKMAYNAENLLMQIVAFKEDQTFIAANTKKVSTLKAKTATLKTGELAKK